MSRWTRKRKKKRHQKPTMTKNEARRYLREEIMSNLELTVRHAELYQRYESCMKRNQWLNDRIVELESRLSSQ